MKADLNFLASYKMTNRHHMARSRASYAIAAMIVVVIAIIALTSLTLIAINIKDSITIADYNSQRVENEIKVKQAQQLQKELDVVLQKQQSINKVLNNLESNRMVSKKELNEIFGTLAADVRIDGISYTKSAMFIKGVATNKLSPSLCAEKLNEAGISASVAYAGFETKESEGPVEYEFTLYCSIGGAEVNE